MMGTADDTDGHSSNPGRRRSTGREVASRGHNDRRTKLPHFFMALNLHFRHGPRRIWPRLRDPLAEMRGPLAISKRTTRGIGSSRAYPTAKVVPGLVAPTNSPGSPCRHQQPYCPCSFGCLGAGPKDLSLFCWRGIVYNRKAVTQELPPCRAPKL